MRPSAIQGGVTRRWRENGCTIAEYENGAVRVVELSTMFSRLGRARAAIAARGRSRRS